MLLHSRNRMIDTLLLTLPERYVAEYLGEYFPLQKCGESSVEIDSVAYDDVTGHLAFYDGILTKSTVVANFGNLLISNIWKLNNGVTLAITITPNGLHLRFGEHK